MLQWLHWIIIGWVTVPKYLHNRLEYIRIELSGMPQSSVSIFLWMICMERIEGMKSYYQKMKETGIRCENLAWLYILEICNWSQIWSNRVKELLKRHASLRYVNRSIDQEVILFVFTSRCCTLKNTLTIVAILQGGCHNGEGSRKKVLWGAVKGTVYN